MGIAEDERSYLRAFGDSRYDYYELTQDLGFLSKGAIFVHDPDDAVRGSVMEGCLKLCWTKEGDCQGHICAETVVFHAEFARSSLFRKVSCCKHKCDEKIEKVLELLHEICETLKGE